MLSWGTVWKHVRKGYVRYSIFMEKQGFCVVLAVCVLVITLSALYTFQYREKTSPPMLETESITAQKPHEQTLEDAQTKQSVASSGVHQTALPTEAPLRFLEPVDGILIRDFSIDEPQLFAHARYWRVHPGIDLEAEYGRIVKACADGRTLDVWEDKEMGLCVRLEHSNDLQSVYAGLTDAVYVKKGDPVRRGQTIGHVGNGVTAEQDAQPHLHFEVWKNQTPVDPIKLFLGTIQP